jgi:hypothetical protein
MDQDVGKGLRHGEIDSGLLPQRGIAYQPKGLPQEHAIKEILYPIGIAASSMLQQDTTRIRREASSVPCPNGGSLASGGVFGPMPQRGIAYTTGSPSIPCRDGASCASGGRHRFHTPTGRRLHPVLPSIPCPNGASPASGVAIGPMPQRGIAYQPRVQPWEHAIRNRCVLKERRIHPTQTDDPGIYGVPSERETWGPRSPGRCPLSSSQPTNTSDVGSNGDSSVQDWQASPRPFPRIGPESTLGP